GGGGPGLGPALPQQPERVPALPLARRRRPVHPLAHPALVQLPAREEVLDVLHPDISRSPDLPQSLPHAACGSHLGITLGAAGSTGRRPTTRLRAGPPRPSTPGPLRC